MPAARWACWCWWRCFVTLIPTTIGALLSADRHRRHGPAGALQRARHVGSRGRGGGRRRHPAARQDRHDHARQPPGDAVPAGLGVSERELADAAQLASLSDETPEGRSIVVLAKEKYNIRGREMAPLHARFIHFSAQTRISGIDIDGARIRKGAVEAVLGRLQGRAGVVAGRPELESIAAGIARDGGTPLAVA
jgi:K+-transporting ATPase ATPase B chain